MAVPEPAHVHAAPQGDAGTDRASGSGRRNAARQLSLRALLFVLAAATTAAISAYASTDVAKVYADKAQSQAIKTALGTQLSVASVRAYDAAYAVALENSDDAPPARSLADRNKVLADWASVSAAVDVSVYAHFSGTPAAAGWQRFEHAVYALVNLSYALDAGGRALWARSVRDYLTSAGEPAPRRPPRAFRDPWVVLACSEPGCAASAEWVADFNWAGLWLTHERQRLILAFFRSAVQNPA